MMSRHVRSGSAGIDSKAFREAVSRMRQEVLESRAETQRFQDQLNCLILLIKRSWNGDRAATLHVSNIVGVSPPAVLLECPENDECKVYAPGKSRAINHWAMLSLGLLNQHYKELEVHALARAKARLESRQDYLEEQVAYHRDLLLAQPIKTTSSSVSTGHVDSGSFFLTERKGIKSNKQSGHARYKRTASGNSHDNSLGTGTQETTPNDMLDFVLDKNSRPKTFCKPELFDAHQVIGERQKPKRPVSGIQQRKADSIRTRPASAVVTKGDRPLKSETTWPINGNVKGQRAKSAKVRGYESNNSKTYVSPTLSKVKVDTQNSHKNNSMSVDLRKMEVMEEEFTKTTKLLQEKLGIDGGGII